MAGVFIGVCLLRVQCGHELLSIFVHFVSNLLTALDPDPSGLVLTVTNSLMLISAAGHSSFVTKSHHSAVQVRPQCAQAHCLRSTNKKWHNAVCSFLYSWTLADLNRSPLPCHGSALPDELRARNWTG